MNERPITPRVPECFFKPARKVLGSMTTCPIPERGEKGRRKRRKKKTLEVRIELTTSR